MKRVLGLDLGTTSIGWALVEEAENENERSSIVKLGVRVNPITVDELTNFEKGKSITTNADRTLKRSMRRNLQRYKLRRENLIDILRKNGFISNDTILSEVGNKTTFETYRLRSKAASEEITLEQLAKVLLMINKKRGYKSSRKAKSQEEDGKLIDGMEIAKQLYQEQLTPGQLTYRLLQNGARHIPDFYRSDLQAELDAIWEYQQPFHPDILTSEFKEQIAGKGKMNTSKIFLGRYGLYAAENKEKDKRLQLFKWRTEALVRSITKEELVSVISEVNGSISSSSGYLGAISDRSKELYFNRQTVGQYLMSQLDKNPNLSLKNQVFYRQDYLDEFNTIWEKQAEFHTQLTEELKREIRDIVIFYQRRLKSQKGLISFCEFESGQADFELDGKTKQRTIGAKVCPRSSPLFQEFKIWQILNNVEINKKSTREIFTLSQEDKNLLFEELSIKGKMTKEDVLKLLYTDYKNYDLNYGSLEGNHTQAELYKVYQNILEQGGHDKFDFSKMRSSEIRELITEVFNGLGYSIDILVFNSDDENVYEQPMYKLWHLLYSFEGDSSSLGNEKLISKLSSLYGFEREFAAMLANVVFKDDYGSLSTKAIRKILPFLKDGNAYSLACEYAGYRHSKNSFTKEENEARILKDRLDILARNSLRNPVVEKILNQMINVVNAIVDTYGKPDEVRIELARELKKSAKEREEMTDAMSKATRDHEKYREILQKEFGLSYVSRNDIIRYKLYLELEPNGFKTLYSDTYISPQKIFSKEFDIEHIVPQSRLFDDSFSNKTLEKREVNIEKGNDTAYDYVLSRYGEDGLKKYVDKVETLFGQKGKKTKLRKLTMKGVDIPNDFIERDIRDTQYIAKKAKSILEDLVRNVTSTSGSITQKLREDWQLVDVLQELNWDKYSRLGLTEVVEGKDGQRLRKIKGWTKRNDHRHHAMDALTVAFTKPSHIQYLNNLNAKSDKSGSIYGIAAKETYKTNNGKTCFKPPIPLDDFRVEAKRHLSNVLISIKAKNKVVTRNTNLTKRKGGASKTTQLTPRGQLHNETIYGRIEQYESKMEKVGSSFGMEQIARVSKKIYRDVLEKRLQEFDNDPKKAFSGKNSLEKNPIWLDDLHTAKLPEKVEVRYPKIVYTIRKEVSPDLKLEKVIDPKIRIVLEKRLAKFGGDSRRAFSNLQENPIWLNKERGISIKRVTITGVSNAEALHSKRSKEGKLLTDEKGQKQPVDFVSTSNNHHVAIYRDANGNLQEKVVSFYEAVTRANQHLPLIDREYRKEDGWEFLFSIKQNEYFVFPRFEIDEEGGETRMIFNPQEIDLLNPDSYHLISPNLYRVQKLSIKDYVFRHHLETTVEDRNELKDITYKRIRSLSIFQDIAKVRVNHIGEIVLVGEY